MKILRIILFLLIPIQSSIGQSNVKITDVAQKSLYRFKYDKSFHGEGWKKIIEAAAEHKYFLIGEDHGLAEIPKFTKALIKNIEYDLFVTEIDSITASIAKQITDGEGIEINSFHEQNPSALSFYSAKEEFEILTELAKHDADLWGLDQVSLFSTGIVFRQLEEVSVSMKAKDLATRLAKKSDELFTKAVKTGNYDALFIYSSKQDVFDELRNVFKNESLEAKNILKDLERSWEIYNSINGANYFTRIKEMKSKLLNYYVTQILNKKKYNKVLYKFGAYHVSRGLSTFGVFDVGNFVSNLAEAEGESSYHLMIIGKQGEMNTFLPSVGMQKVKFNIEENKSNLNSLMPFAELVGQDEWVFFDLKNIREQLKKENFKVDNRLLETTIHGYDGLIIIPTVSASKN